MQDHILVSYSCTHFAVLPADVSQENYDWLFNDCQAAAETDLISRRITSHLALPQACPNPACERFRLRSLTDLIRTAESEIHAALIETRKAYLRYGKTYHLELHPLSRARRLKDPDCALAHKQFTLETRTFHNDPFFMPWRALQSGYIKIKAASQDSHTFLTFSNAKRIAKNINDCRFEISKIEYLLNQLYDGINIFQGEARSLKDDMEKRKNIVVAHMPKRSSSKTKKPKGLLGRKLERITTRFKEAKLRTDLEIELDSFRDALELDSDSIVSTFTPHDELTGKMADVAFIEFRTAKQAKEIASVTTALGDIELTKKRQLTFTKLADVSRFDIDDLRDANMIPSRSQGAIDEMRRHIRQRSKDQLSHEDRKANYAEMSGSALQEHLAKMKTADLLSRRMDHWGTKLIDKSDVNGDTRHLKHAVFPAMQHTRLG
ncbi:hypothetical protein HII31_11583 [Pseudocercospora fuligena]|uniref:Uncharacterized protein n=1 Tax=Pseudocercospora fuligena TaxID=685502 RepID=A0A8H6VG81_9PEZI|nr:hypothetical protein HII31_11583 [Pseudocercospora fuligena]